MNHFYTLFVFRMSFVVSLVFCRFVSVLSLFANIVQQAYDCSLGYLNFLCVSGAYTQHFAKKVCNKMLTTHNEPLFTHYLCFA